MLDINSFDEDAIAWRELPDVENVWLSILDVDEKAKIVDVLFRFAANEKIVLHRHVSAFHTFVVKGEHRIYTPEGELKEVRPVGTYKREKPIQNLTPRVGGIRMWLSCSAYVLTAMGRSMKSSTIREISSTP